jgi:hypothetical protein
VSHQVADGSGSAVLPGCRGPSRPARPPHRRDRSVRGGVRPSAYTVSSRRVALVCAVLPGSAGVAAGSRRSRRPSRRGPYGQAPPHRLARERDGLQAGEDCAGRRRLRAARTRGWPAVHLQVRRAEPLDRLQDRLALAVGRP